jgi:hypothetical protein
MMVRRIDDLVLSVRQETTNVFCPRQVNRDPGWAYLKCIFDLGMAIIKSILLPADEDIIGSS